METKEPKLVKRLLGIRSYLQISLFIRIAGEFNKDDRFKEFQYPLIEYLDCLFELPGGLKYLPFKIHIIRLKVQLQKTTGVYIPILY